ncbi:MAG: RDD family protein [Prevotellaceae bacterium]|nr:RDD family protein [Candidatus Minthosoma caballi]
MAYKKHNIVNSQFVHIEQTPASVGVRMIAFFIDMVVQGFMWWGIAYLVTAIDIMHDDDNLFLAIFLLMLPLFYHPLCEQFFQGVSLGKAILGLRVVMLNGESVTISASALRWLLGYIDFGFSFLGLTVMICNRHNQRIGDLAAGCIIIHEKRQHQILVSMQKFTAMSDTYQPTYPLAANLTWGQICFINKTSYRLTQIASSQRKRNVRMLAEKIAKMWNITLQGNPNEFLHTIVSDYNYYTWHDNV